MNNLFLVFVLTLFSFASHASVWVVDSLNDAGYGSLRAAADSALAGDTIRFNPYLLSSGSDSIVLTTGEIAFGAKGITIKGLYTTTDTLYISGNDSSRIFSFNGAGRVVLDSLVLINGNGVGVLYSGNGGAIYRYNCTDTLFVLNSTVSGNTASISGGGIYSGYYSFSFSFHSAVTVINSTISDNTATGGPGGGIYSYADVSSVTVTNSTLSGNTAIGNGGGVFSSASSSSSLVAIIHSTLSGNSAIGSGGGVFSNSSSSSSVTVEYSIISGNTANTTNTINYVGSGGGIYSYSESISFSSSSSVTVTNSTISGNTTTGANGGGIYSESYSEFSSTSSSSSVTVTNSMISGNTAVFSSRGGDGGGIYSKSISSPISVASSSSSLVTITNSEISGNIASAGNPGFSGGNGGGVYSESNSYIPSFSNTTHCPSTSSVIVTGCTVSGNSATFEGGGIYSESLTSFFSSYSSISVTSSTISGNTAGAGGGVFSESQSYSTNHPHNSPSLSSVTITKSTISGNTAIGNGGGIYTVYASASFVTVTNSTISGNTANYGGGINTLTPALITVTSSIIAENGSNISGISNSDTTTIISNGYNIFSDTITGAIASDSINTTATQLNLQPLAFNGGPTQTMSPGMGSIAIDNGNPNDASMAQNLPIIGTRDVGAAEYCARTFFTDTILSCASYFTWMDGNTYIINNNSATHTISNAVGCDSVITLNLTLHNLATIDTVHGCDSVVWINGNTYYPGHGVVSDTLTNSLGCDSVVFLLFIPSNFGVDQRVVCDSLTWINGVTYYSNNNSALDTLISSFGCDSVVTLDLIVFHSTVLTITDTVCGSSTSPSGMYVWTSSGTYMDTIPNSVNCDSIITINLTVNNFSTSTITETGCGSYTSPSGSYIWTSTGSYMDTIPNSVNCDSIITFNLTINNSSMSTIAEIVCSSYTSPSGNYVWTSSGSYMDTIPNSVNCDSIISINLTVNSTRSTDVEVACGSYTWMDGNTYYTSSTTAKDTLVNAVGCDSIITLNLTINPIYTTIDVQMACDSLTWVNGATYYANNSTATYATTSVWGCDSIVTLDLTVNHTVNIVDTVSSCYVYQWINGQAYLSDNNTAMHTLTSSTGCDSVITLDLSVHYGSMGVDSQVVCDSLIWLDGNTYYSNNTSATHTISGGNINGCDSVITLNLTVNNNTGIDVVSSCSDYTWIDGITYNANNNSATHVLINSLGCDSVVTLDLTLLSNTGTEVVTACDSFTWNGVTYTSSNNMARDTLVNIAGCDSIVALDLTILNSTFATEEVSVCDSYNWNGIAYTSSNNTATDTLVNTAGCDSIVTLDLTILNSTNYTDVITACDRMTWIDGITYTSSTQSPTITLTNAAGCDSVVSLDLSITVVDTAITTQDLTLTAQAQNATYRWLDCENGNTPLPNETANIFVVELSGNYAVEVTQNGCVDTSACFEFINVGIDEITINDHINIYPNPVHDQFTLEITNWQAVHLDITVLDVNGKIVHTQEIENATVNKTLQFNTSKWSRGVYFVKVSDGVKTSTTKLILQ